MGGSSLRNICSAGCLLVTDDRHRQSRFIVDIIRSLNARTHVYMRLSGAYGRKVHRLRIEVTSKIMTVMKSGLYRAVDRAVTNALAKLKLLFKFSSSPNSRSDAVVFVCVRYIVSHLFSFFFSVIIVRRIQNGRALVLFERFSTYAEKSA